MHKQQTIMVVESGNQWDLPESILAKFPEDLHLCASCDSYHLYGDLYDTFLRGGPVVIDRVFKNAVTNASA